MRIETWALQLRDAFRVNEVLLRRDDELLTWAG